MKNFPELIRSGKIIIKYNVSTIFHSKLDSHRMRFSRTERFRSIILADSDAYPLSQTLLESLIKNVQQKEIGAVKPTNLCVFGETPLKETMFHFLTIRKKVITKIGLPDKSLFIYGDDEEYGLRIKSQGLLLKSINATYVHPPALMYGRRLVYHLRNDLSIIKRYSNRKITSYMFGFLLSTFFFSILEGLKSLQDFLQALRALRTEGPLRIRDKSYFIEKTPVSELTTILRFKNVRLIIRNLQLYERLNLKSKSKAQDIIIIIIKPRHPFQDLFKIIRFSGSDKHRRAYLISSHFYLLLLSLLFSKVDYGLLPWDFLNRGLRVKIICLPLRRKLKAVFYLIYQP